jgi:hypothetical protein
MRPESLLTPLLRERACRRLPRMCPHTAKSMSAYCNEYVRMLLLMCSRNICRISRRLPALFLSLKFLRFARPLDIVKYSRAKPASAASAAGAASAASAASAANAASAASAASGFGFLDASLLQTQRCGRWERAYLLY